MASPSRPPVARVEPVVEIHFGRTVSDPYRWMENPGDPDWARFMAEQGEHARQVLDGLPRRAALLERIAELSGEQVAAGAVQFAGGRVFHELRPAGAETMVISVADRLGGAARVLVDPALRGGKGAHVAIDWWSAAPCGRRLAYGLSKAGSEQSVLHVLDADTGADLPEQIDRTPFAGPSWLPDGSAFFYNRLPKAPPKSVASRQNSVCYLHRLGEDPGDDVAVFGGGLHTGVPVEPLDIPAVYADPSSEYVVAVLYGGVRHANPIYVARLEGVLAGAPAWRKVADVEDAITDFAFRGEELFLLSTKNAPNGQVLQLQLGSPDLASAATVVPESPLVIEGLKASADAVYLRCIEGGLGRLRRLAASGLQSVTLPYDGSIVGLYASTDDARIHLALTGWLQPRSVWAYDPAHPELIDARFPPKPAIDTSPYEATLAYAPARDGTRVPVSIVARRGAPRDGNNPTLVNGYGAYQVVLGPQFNARAFAFLEAGGVLVTAHVRGGGEYGEAWWAAGRGPTKPNSWRDLIDVCEHLIAERWTRPEHLSLRGGSAGGITVGRALTERPDLFAAVVCGVGVLNTLRAEFAANGPPNVPEYGSISDPAGFAALLAMDSVQAVQDGVSYPAVLLTHGMTDFRVEPWHSAKMAARLQAATSGGEVLLRVTFDAGHGLGSTRTQLDEETADVYAFVLHACVRQLGDGPRDAVP